MKYECEYCEPLNLSDFLGSSGSLSNSDEKMKLIRYYCQNDHSGNDYCPNKGDNSQCRNYKKKA